jgi:hypothetical protein
MISSPSAVLTPIMRCLFVLLILPSITRAQFQFFNNFFDGQQQQQQPQEKQNVASDSSWYQQVVESGMKASSSLFSLYSYLSIGFLKFLLPIQQAI